MKAEMRNDGSLVLIPETARDRQDLSFWKVALAGHFLAQRKAPGDALVLEDAGPLEEPLNVLSTGTDANARLISNLAETPFRLDGREYRSVESFWQGLKFEKQEDRDRIASMDGRQARREGQRRGYRDYTTYAGKHARVGSPGQWLCMIGAALAKFSQNEEARNAILATGERKLTHVVKSHASTAIPGAVMAGIWTWIRVCLRERPGLSYRGDE